METKPLIAHCFVAAGPRGHVLTVSAQEQTFCTAELPSDQLELIRTVDLRVAPVLASLVRRGFSLQLHLEGEAQQLWFSLGAILHPYFDDLGSLVPVTFAPGLEVEAEAPAEDAPPQPEALAALAAPPPIPPPAPEAPVPAAETPPIAVPVVQLKAPPVAKPSTREPLPLSAMSDGQLLHELGICVQREDARAAAYEREYLRRHEGSAAAKKKLADVRERAKQTRAAKRQLSDAVRRGDPRQVDQALQGYAKHVGQKLALKFLERERAYRNAKRAEAKSSQQRKAAGRPQTDVKADPKREHELHRLRPSPQWQLIIDETGFEGPNSFSGVVGVLVPGATQLPPLKDFHAVTENTERRDQAMQALLDAPVGVLGLDASQVQASSDPWLASVLELVGWAVRLMPLEGPTKLGVFVEHRGAFVAETSWTVAFGLLQRQLVQLDPARYAQLELEVNVVGKDFPLGGYADVVAHAWSRRSPESIARIEASGLLGSCLMSGNPARLREVWDVLATGGAVSGAQWLALLGSPDARAQRSLTAHALSTLKQRCGSDLALWERLLEAVIAHEQSKAVDLRALGQQLSWLREAQPQAPLPKRLELAWLTAQLERSNHEGDVGLELEARLEALSAQLVDEAPELVCQADLNRAVRLTNAFRFAEADTRLTRWSDARPREAGLQHWGRLLSQQGQHAAFLGQPAKAIEHFLAALDAFGRLSDEELGKLERSQTQSYLAVATMDLPGAPLELVRERVSRVASLELDRISALATDTSVASRYKHHVLLRFLVRFGTEAERAAYWDCREDWSYDKGHPWQLILAYRAMLAWPLDPALARLLFRDAVAQTRNAGSTLVRIGEAIDAEAKAMEQGAPALSVLPGLLPFNFR